MKLTSPINNIDENATEALIESTISGLKAEPDAFAILENDEMNYIQALRVEHGFIVQFQNGSVDKHFEFDTYLSRPQTIALFKSYLHGIENWQGDLAYSKTDLRGFAGRIGFAIGSFFGGFVRGYKEAKKK
jgi:hypothetical protein